MNRGPQLLKWVVGLLALVALVALARSAGGLLPEFAEWIASLGYWGPLIFVIAYVLAAVLFVPGALLTLAGGAIFGLVEGTVLVFIAATLGSGLAFLIARYLARESIEARIRSNPRFSAVDRAVARDGLKITFLLRLSPIFPFNFINYALGLTKVGFRDYMLASIGMLPGTILYVYYGRVIGDVAALAAGATPDGGLAQQILTGVGLVATIAVTTVVTRVARRALAEAGAGDEAANAELAPASPSGSEKPLNS